MMISTLGPLETTRDQSLSLSLPNLPNLLSPYPISAATLHFQTLPGPPLLAGSDPAGRQEASFFTENPCQLRL